ncbi:MAG: AMP-dependent synthetase [Thermonema sp.]|uniref:AMP-dependent synthetase/ligase n=1 Tax=Thermonema sp. TaxID=2231181 RepID=UPI0021DBCF44|nr:long-chain fatty acid--CoA ligase [Thermonema sp.]GIV39899.1 MAG: AMP-dependent synthetase [Thermonema sp.]
MEIKRVYDLLRYQLEHYQKKDAVADKKSGEWKTYSTQDLMQISDEVALGLHTLGIQKDDKVAIISNNRTEWNFVDFGIQKIGAVSVPLYPTITADDYLYILEHSESKIVFVENEEIYAKALEAVKKSKHLTEKNIYTFDQIEGAQHWTVVREAGKQENKVLLERRDQEIQPDDLFTIIYTSGTTGKPKGVMLTHSNVVSNVLAAIDNLVLDYRHKALSFLPLCHIFERTLVAAYIYKGISIYYAENMDKIGDNIREVQPHVFTAVPRVLEKVYAKLVQKGYELSGLKKSLYFWALDLAKEYDTQKDQGLLYNIQLAIANNLIFSKWREALGGNLKYIICGSAALNPMIARVFWAACIPILEGYGMTETSPVITATSPNKEDVCIGTVGKVIPGVEVKIAEDGEILVKGPNVMKGYYKDPEKTKEVFDEEGWLHTGDIGEFVQGKYLKITDRKKEMFKTSGGKYIAPQPIENQLKASFLIAQAMVIGEGRKFPAAFIMPDWEALTDWCKKHGIPTDSREAMIQHPKVLEKYQEEVDKINEKLAKYEQIKQFRLVPDEWSIEGGELTPTLKLKRRNILAKYKHLEEDIYKLNEELA